MKSDGQLWRRARLRQCKYLNNIVEQDHRRIKRLVRPGLGFGSFRTARQTLAGFETMAMMRKGQVRKIDVMISGAKPSSSPTCSRGPHQRSEPAHHLRASLVNIVATEPFGMRPLAGAKA